MRIVEFMLGFVLKKLRAVLVGKMADLAVRVKLRDFEWTIPVIDKF